MAQLIHIFLKKDSKMSIFRIKPYIETKDEKYFTFVSEIYQMPFSMIQDGIDSCLLVMDEQYPEMNWGLEVFDLTIHKETAVLSYNREFVAEIPTKEIYDMLVKYRDKLTEYESG
ncbi:MAG: hypothetical protein FWF72_04255 [Paludibacter sp.]|nr:hypothetical protein [Paludibacter sp.]